MATADPKLVLAKAGLDARRKLADAQIVAKLSVDSRSTLGIAPDFLQVTSPLVLQCLQALERADSSKTRRRDWHARMDRWMDLCSSGVRRGYMPQRCENVMITRHSASDQSRNNDKVMLAGMVWQASSILWSSFAAWLVKQIDAGQLTGIMMMIYISSLTRR